MLLFQALLLAHGGLTTLGANLFSLGVVGPLLAYGIFRLGRMIRLPQGLALFAAATLGDVATYLTTSMQLALAFPDPVSGFAGAFAKFAGIFAVTQIPLAISEGLLTVLIFNRLAQAQCRRIAGTGPAACAGGSSTMNRNWRDALLLLAVVALVAYPLLTVRPSQGGPGGPPAGLFAGADGQAEAVVRQLAPDYRPWAAPLMEPPSGEIESLLFTLQAVLGAGFIGYYLGVKRERTRSRRSSGA